MQTNAHGIDIPTSRRSFCNAPTDSVFLKATGDYPGSVTPILAKLEGPRGTYRLVFGKYGTSAAVPVGVYTMSLVTPILEGPRLCEPCKPRKVEIRLGLPWFDIELTDRLEQASADEVRERMTQIQLWLQSASDSVPFQVRAMILTKANEALLKAKR